MISLVFDIKISALIGLSEWISVDFCGFLSFYPSFKLISEASIKYSGAKLSFNLSMDIYIKNYVIRCYCCIAVLKVLQYQVKEL